MLDERTALMAKVRTHKDQVATLTTQVQEIKAMLGKSENANSALASLLSFQNEQTKSLSFVLASVLFSLSLA